MSFLRRIIGLLVLTLGLLGPSTFIFGAAGAWNGVAFTALNAVAQTAWNGTGISCAGGGGSWWVVSGKTPVGVYQPKGAASLAASYTNLANPGTNDAAPGTAPTWDATRGWIFTGGSSQYLLTGPSNPLGLIPATGWTIIVRFSGNATGGNTCLAGADNAGLARFYVCASVAAQRLYGGGGFAFTGSAVASGVIAIANNHPYYNGSADGSDTTAWGTTQSQSIYIGAWNDGFGSPALFSTADIQAVAIYSDTLTAGEIATVTTAMNAL